MNKLLSLNKNLLVNCNTYLHIIYVNNIDYFSSIRNNNIMDSLIYLQKIYYKQHILSTILPTSPPN